jgi:hypothetical protein
MSPLTIFLSRLIGLFAVLVSLALLMAKKSGVEAVDALIHDRPLMLTIGIIAVIAGLAMVLSHNVWSGGALPVVVTLLGWIILIRGVLILFLSPDAMVSLVEMFRFEEFFYLYVAIPLFLGLYLTYAGFKSSSPSPAARMDSDRSRRS